MWGQKSFFTIGVVVGVLAVALVFSQTSWLSEYARPAREVLALQKELQEVPGGEWKASGDYFVHVKTGEKWMWAHTFTIFVGFMTEAIAIICAIPVFIVIYEERNSYNRRESRQFQNIPKIDLENKKFNGILDVPKTMFLSKIPFSWVIHDNVFYFFQRDGNFTLYRTVMVDKKGNVTWTLDPIDTKVSVHVIARSKTDDYSAALDEFLTPELTLECQELFDRVGLPNSTQKGYAISGEHPIIAICKNDEIVRMASYGDDRKAGKSILNSKHRKEFRTELELRKILGNKSV